MLRKKAFRVGSVRLTGMRACCARGAVSRGGLEGRFWGAPMWGAKKVFVVFAEPTAQRHRGLGLFGMRF